MRFLSRHALLAAAILTCGCNRGDDDEPAPPAPDTTAAEPQAPAPPPLADSQLVNITQTVNNLEIEFGTLALARAADAEVRSYAQTMIADHRAMNQIADSIARVDSIRPADNLVSQQFRAQAEVTRADLNARTGTDFDRAYITHEIEFYRALLDRIDRELIHKAQRPAVSRYFERLRPAFAAYLQRAEQIRNRLSPQPGQPAPSPQPPPRPTSTTTQN